MKNFEENKLESVFVVLVTEKCWRSTSAFLSRQNHKNAFKFILFKNFHFGRTQLLIVKGMLRTSEKGLLLRIKNIGNNEYRTRVDIKLSSLSDCINCNYWINSVGLIEMLSGVAWYYCI